MKENYEDAPELAPLETQDVIYSVAKPYAPAGMHISVLKGNLCPDGAVIKLSGKDVQEFSGK